MFVVRNYCNLRRTYLLEHKFAFSRAGSELNGIWYFNRWNGLCRT